MPVPGRAGRSSRVGADVRSFGRSQIAWSGRPRERARETGVLDRATSGVLPAARPRVACWLAAAVGLLLLLLPGSPVSSTGLIDGRPATRTDRRYAVMLQQQATGDREGEPMKHLTGLLLCWPAAVSVRDVGQRASRCPCPSRLDRARSLNSIDASSLRRHEHMTHDDAFVLWRLVRIDAATSSSPNTVRLIVGTTFRRSIRWHIFSFSAVCHSTPGMN